MDDGKIQFFEELMALETLDKLDIAESIKKLGLLIDISGDLERDEGIARALDWCDLLEQRELTEQQTAKLEYFRSNAWANRQKIRHKDVKGAAWQWEQPELQAQAFHLRRAAQLPGFPKLSRLEKCQIYTNLANQLNTVGRFVEALEMWTRALAITPNFGMALGNRGYGLMSYARSLYDPGHRETFLRFAHRDLTVALSSKALYESDNRGPVQAFFQIQRAKIETALKDHGAKDRVKMDGYALGSSKGERQYRQWTLQSRLFLNPLNDLGTHSIAARDILSLPDFTTAIGEPPSLAGFFNQMKQEFVSARWLLFDGLHSGRVHFSDRHVALYNTLDYPSYSLAVEKVKAAYRMGYSLLDKIAVFLNHYASLNVNPKNIYFRSIWYEDLNLQKRIVREEFASSKNWPFRGLYWLSKDI